ncbi:LppU/SCO3897 family protein [Lentzea xinjiangensis]|uniref:LppU/SCO3897 family protein n=1 Tax=Lentzea xinjiangensis TaxID=402600 RepID=UPI001160E0EF|nr:hypothetical protein [Lentzea xinjiangensis]
MAGLTALLPREEPEPATPTSALCFEMAGGSKSVGPRQVDCSAGEVSYRVALTVESPDWSLDPGACPEGPYLALRWGTGDTMCLALSVREGDCLSYVKPRKGTKPGELGRTDCTNEPYAEVRKVVTGERLSCGPGQKAVHYSQPPLTICLEEL